MKRFIVLLCTLAVLAGCTLDNGDGEKIGTITRLNQSGVVWSTWEGELLRGGLSQGSGSFGAPFHFTVKATSGLVEKVRTAMLEQQEVKIRYRLWSNQTPWNGEAESDGYLTSIEVLHPGPKSVAGQPVEVGTDIRAIVRDELRKAFSEVR